MKGYLGKEKETKDKIKNNWLYTGDIGEIDKDNYLIITDRKKDIIVTTGGDNIAPQKIENMFTSNDLMSQVIVFGDNKPFLVALIFINNNYSKKNRINNEIDKYLKKINEKLSPTEKIRKYMLINEQLDQKSGFLTPTMKIKRKKVYEKYKKDIEGFYN
jgi:long-chain acyl-CoA synthetase